MNSLLYFQNGENLSTEDDFFHCEDSTEESEYGGESTRSHGGLDFVCQCGVSQGSFSPPNASVAQLVEQLTLNQLVLGSNPSRGTFSPRAAHVVKMRISGYFFFFEGSCAFTPMRTLISDSGSGFSSPSCLAVVAKKVSIWTEVGSFSFPEY